MTDPMFTGDLFIDGCFPIKAEPMEGSLFGGNNTSASMPIPTRRTGTDLSEFGFDMNNPSPGGSSFHDNTFPSSSLYSGSSMWSPRSDIKMEDDDIFQVDKADLIQGPTLAELNANDDTLLEDLNFDDLVLPEETHFLLPVPREIPQQLTTPINIATSFPPNNMSFFKDFRNDKALASSLKIVPGMVGVMEEKPVLEELDISGSSMLVGVGRSPTGGVGGLSPQSPALSPQGAASPQLSPRGLSPHKPTTLHDLLLKNTMQQYNTAAGGGIPARSNSVGNRSRPTNMSRLSSSAPTHLGLEQIWQRREPRPHLLSTSSLAEATSTSSLSTGGILSPEAHDFSLDEGFDSEEDSEHDEDDSSDAESVSDGEGGCSKMSKKERYFWQYNVQSKGPKGQRLILRNKLEDPHYLDEVTDPVFSPGCSLQGIKHSGKARKGDGNDLTPNPKKLSAIGRELEKLTRMINDMTPVNELPMDVRPKSRKEKNKLASRACRLKKKAQHEANKIKLQGLETEHKKLMNGIHQMKQLLATRVSGTVQDPQEPSKVSEKIVKYATRLKIAGQTTEFVNRILDRLKCGVPNGGLDELHHHPT